MERETDLTHPPPSPETDLTHLCGGWRRVRATKRAPWRAKPIWPTYAVG